MEPEKESDVSGGLEGSEKDLTRIRRTIVVQGDDSKESLGLVHIYTGDGKGKTTASLGLALRALGNGLRVNMIQFLKSADTGELFAIKKYLPNMKIVQYGVEAINDTQSRIFEFQDGKEHDAEVNSRFRFMPDDAEKEACRRGMELALHILKNKECDILILDELNVAVNKGIISIESVRSLLDDKGNIEIIMTGWGATDELKELGDYVSYIQKIRHPWEKGIKARKGIEY